MKTFRTSSVDAQILLAVPGGRDLERKLQTLLQELQIEREIFHLGGRIVDFLDRHLRDGLEAAVAYLEETKYPQNDDWAHE